MPVDVDEEWLKSLRFQTYGGFQITGYLGQGAEAVTLEATGPEGKQAALRFLKPHLGLYLREIPPELMIEPAHDVAILNEKLAAMVGDPVIGLVAHTINRTHAYLAKYIWEHSLTDLLALARSQSLLIDSVPLIVRDASFRLRFDDWASLTPPADHPFITVNVPFVIDEFGSLFRDRAKEIIDQLEDYEQKRGGQVIFADNAYYVWMAAVLDGFFREEFEQAAAFLLEKVGSITEAPDAGDKVMQISGLLDTYSYLFAREDDDGDRARLRRAVKFLRCANCILDVRDARGAIVAAGWSSA